MLFNKALETWLAELSGMDSYWLKVPEGQIPAVTFRLKNMAMTASGLTPSGVHQDRYLITVQHSDPIAGSELAEHLTQQLHGFRGQVADFSIQLIELVDGEDSAMPATDSNPGFQFQREFEIYY